METAEKENDYTTETAQDLCLGDSITQYPQYHKDRSMCVTEQLPQRHKNSRRSRLWA